MSEPRAGATSSHAQHSPNPSSKRTAWRHVGVLVAALLVVIGVATTLALRSNHTVGAVNPAPQTLMPQTGEEHEPATITPPTVAPASVPLVPPATPRDSGDLESSFAEVTRASGAKVGVAIAPIGNGSAPKLFGDQSLLPAWSTIKVPLAMAALRGSQLVTGAARAAITQSDNAAAEELWESLGDPGTAAGKVESVLSEAGDPTTVESRRVRPEFSAFGQTRWPLASQASFLAAAGCDARNGPVLDLMNQIASDQRWGLGKLPGARFKGGWGPSPSGQYIVRQIGIVDTQSGKVAVALAAAPASGSFADGVSAMNSVAAWLGVHNAQLPSGVCES
jgi:hypothetical protein